MTTVPGASAPAAGGDGACYNLSAQLPAGPNATISSGDWSGVGTGDDGASWDFQTCSLLVEAIGTNNVTDMFPPRAWTPGWLADHCQARFGVTPRPTELVDAWGWRDVDLPRTASRIVFTNGLNDGWSAGGVTVNLTSTLLAFNSACRGAMTGGEMSAASPARPRSAADAPPARPSAVPNGAHHSDLSHAWPSPLDTPDVLATRQAVSDVFVAWLAELAA